MRSRQCVLQVLLLHEPGEPGGGLAARLRVGLWCGAVVRHLLPLVLLDLSGLDVAHLIIDAADLIPAYRGAALLRARVVALVRVALLLNTLIALYLLQVLFADEHEIGRLRLARP